MVKVGINGFGRIGRNVLRAALNNPDIQIVAINDLTDSKTLAHLLKYDSLLGKLDAEVTAGEGGLVVDGKPITVFSERNPRRINTPRSATEAAPPMVLHLLHRSCTSISVLNMVS